ncbi:MAG: class I SAM-dependent methyltransferase [Reyranella sp.]|uniref:class I SAM-dependent methyltransferase n=1 Tax=Reyranella sp. TaxID=1929291 RepID=UPI001AC77A31|nr:class I SAM-dependent methyltransferase [Reyranella sp.]MBN9090153.1 class I SAM-dependent methyltransferase [Reyranella sp.]
MTTAPTPQPYDPERYRSAAAHYEHGRVSYAPALIRRVAEVVGLRRQHRVLDLGCGPGPLARQFAPLAQEVVAMDPTPEMLNAARALAGGIANIRFVAGSSYELDPALGRFHLVVMGRSFHWMDRVDTLKRLDRMIEPAGAVALFADSAPAIPANAWLKTWQDICARYEPKIGAHAHDPNWIRHEAVLLDSPFAWLEQFGVIERRPLDVETLVQRTLSMGSTSPGHLGETGTAAITAEVRSALADVREEVVMTSALVAWRP